VTRTALDEDARRSAVVEAAARLLADEGPHALSLRRVAADAGGSTQLVYTLFGGKPGLVDALYAEGFRRLGDRMAAALPLADDGDPEQLVQLGLAYRAFALAEPAFFSVMFGRAVPGFEPRRRTRADGRERSFGHVVAAAQRCLDAGTLVAPDAVFVARMCWAVAHGIASLEVASLIGGDDHEAFARDGFRRLVDAHRP
jgi:AcrR family transcriptional regulator